MKNVALMLRLWLLLPSFCLFAACAGNEKKQETASSTAAVTKAPEIDGHLFTLLPSGYTGVHFVNRVENSPDFNVFTYRNFYNGGGVAVGDLNGETNPWRGVCVLRPDKNSRAWKSCCGESRSR